MYLFKLLFSFYSDIYPGVGVLDHTVALFLVFWGISKLFSIVALPIYIPTIHVQEFPFLRILPNIRYFCSFGDGHSDRCKVISQRGDDFQFSPRLHKVGTRMSRFQIGRQRPRSSTLFQAAELGAEVKPALIPRLCSSPAPDHGWSKGLCFALKEQQVGKSP